MRKKLIFLILTNVRTRQICRFAFSRYDIEEYVRGKCTAQQAIEKLEHQVSIRNIKRCIFIDTEVLGFISEHLAEFLDGNARQKKQHVR